MCTPFRKELFGHKITVKFSMSCDVKNVVYVIICKGCKEEYVEETNDLRKRMSVHRNHIRDPSHRILKVSRHIDNCIDVEPKFNVFPLFKMNTDCEGKIIHQTVKTNITFLDVSLSGVPWFIMTLMSNDVVGVVARSLCFIILIMFKIKPVEELAVNFFNSIMYVK